MTETEHKLTPKLSTRFHKKATGGSHLKPIAILLAAITISTHADGSYNVVWDSPSKDHNGSMPLGNGDIGVNAWAQADGTLHVLIGKTDSWDDNARLVKVGKVIFQFPPDTFTGNFRQELDLATGSILIQDNIRLWVDANQPVIHLTTDLPVTARPALWRTEKYTLPASKSAT
jgi:hypothetical protein